MNPLPRKARIIREYKVQYSDPITVAAGKPVTVGREDDECPGWKWTTSSDGRAGWVPVELLSNEGPQAFVLQDYSARELAVQPCEDVIVEKARQGWILVRNSCGQRGWIPASHSEPE